MGSTVSTTKQQANKHISLFSLSLFCPPHTDVQLSFCKPNQPMTAQTSLLQATKLSYSNLSFGSICKGLIIPTLLQTVSERWSVKATKGGPQPFSATAISIMAGGFHFYLPPSLVVPASHCQFSSNISPTPHNMSKGRRHTLGKAGSFIGFLYL